MNKLSIILGVVIWCVGIGAVNAKGCGKQGMTQPQSQCTSSNLNCSGASKACCVKRSDGSLFCGSHLANPAANDQNQVLLP